jgi:hypothetical protein
MTSVVIVLVHILTWGAPMAALMGVPALVVLYAVRFAKRTPSLKRTFIATIGAFVAIPLLLFIVLNVMQALTTSGLLLLHQKMGTENQTRTEDVEHKPAPVL